MQVLGAFVVGLVDHTLLSLFIAAVVTVAGLRVLGRALCVLLVRRRLRGAVPLGDADADGTGPHPGFPLSHVIETDAVLEHPDRSACSDGDADAAWSGEGTQPDPERLVAARDDADRDDERGGAGTLVAPMTTRSALWFLGLGAITGLLSALTGTGGPFVLTPLLYTLRPEMSPQEVTAAALACSVCVSGAATVSNVLHSTVDAGLALIIAAALLAGVPMGYWVGARVSAARLRVVVAALLVAVGAASLSRTLTALSLPWSS